MGLPSKPGRTKRHARPLYLKKDGVGGVIELGDGLEGVGNPGLDGIRRLGNDVDVERVRGGPPRNHTPPTSATEKKGELQGRMVRREVGRLNRDNECGSGSANTTLADRRVHEGAVDLGVRTRWTREKPAGTTSW